MKGMRKLSAILLAVMLCVGMINIPVFAATSTQDGLEVTLTTDKESYSQNDQIEATLTVKNTNSVAVSNVSLENVVPEGYKLAEGTEATKQIESLRAGKTVSLTVTYIPDDSNNNGEQPGTGGVDKPGTGDNTGSTGQAGNGGSDENGKNTGTGTNNSSGSNGKSDSSPSTGDNSNLALWIGLFVLAGGIVALIVLRKKSGKKAGKKLLSLFLCVMMAGAMIPASTIHVNAAVAQGKISLSQDVSVESDMITLSALVVYDEVNGEITDTVDQTDTTDTDNDGTPDWVEKEFGADPSLDDTDRDGINDYDEILILMTDPAKVDTDGNGVSDADEDFDNDGISNLKEINSGTNPLSADSDGDGLSDHDEYTFGTDPVNDDTDGDGASDGIEVQLGTDPLSANDAFDVKLESDNEDSVSAAVDINLSGEQISTLSIESEENSTLFPEKIPGYMGKAYNFSVEGAFNEATISFKFDPTSVNSAADPTIYYYNEDTQELEALDTVVSNGVASAIVSHFSTYILINRTVYEESFSWEDTWDTEASYKGVEVVLVIDDSGSMTSNDSSKIRLSVACDLIDSLPADSKIGVVKFASSTNILTEVLTTDREEAKTYLTTDYFKSSGGTYMYNAINGAFGLFDTTDESILKTVIVLSDGATSDTSKHSSTISTANENNVRIYTVGLGNSTSYFTKYLDPLANNTGGEFYLAADASELVEIYNDINKKIDIETDSDSDGIPDYYEDNIVAFNGVKIELDKNNPDTDGDGIPDGEEVTVNLKYNEDKTKVIVTGKYNSSPILIDSDDDGIPDYEDTEPLKKGLAGGVIGQLTLISCYNGENAGWTSGHVFFVYTSYIKDSLNLSTLAHGWSRIDPNKGWSWNNLQKDNPLQSEYKVKVDESMAIGNGAMTGGWFGIGNGSGSSGSSGDSSGSSGSGTSGSGSSSGSGSGSSNNTTGSGGVSDCNGVCYNMEVDKYLDPEIGYTYEVNTYLSENITENQLKQLVAYCSKGSVNYWNLTHNCATVACEAWNVISDTQVNPYSDDFMWGKVATPKGLKINLRTIDGSKENYNFVGEFQ